MSGSNHCDWCGSSWCADCVAERNGFIAEIARARTRAAVHAEARREQAGEIERLQGWEKQIADLVEANVGLADEIERLREVVRFTFSLNPDHDDTDLIGHSLLPLPDDIRRTIIEECEAAGKGGDHD